MRLVAVNISASGTYIVPLDVHRGDGVAIGIVPVSGSPNPTIQHSFQNSGAAGWTEAGSYWFNHASLVSVSITSDGHYAYIPHTLRIVQTNPGDCVVYIQQNGLA